MPVKVVIPGRGARRAREHGQRSRVRVWRILSAAGAGAVLTAVGGHLSRRLRRAQLATRFMILADDVPVEVLLEREVGVPVRDGNRVELLENGAIFDALEHQIREARETIHICEFMWRGEGDPSARIGKAILERRPGVKVRVVVDWFGSKKFDPKLERQLVESGCELRRHQVLPDPFRLNHRRIFVFDGRTAFVGGFGIWKSWLGDGVSDHGGEDEWRDTAACVKGPAVGDLQRAFDHSWQTTGGPPLLGDAYPRLRPDGDHLVATVASTPKWARTTLAARMYYALLASARRRVYVANSYFVPDRSLQNVLISRARAGVDVRVLAPGPHHDVPIVQAGQRRTYARLLHGGVRIWEYQPSMMHAKTIVADDVAVIGSTNMDSESLSFLWETSIVTNAPDVSRRLAERFEVDLSHSLQIVPQEWKRRPLHRKVGEAAAIVADPWL
jgi:cardiolipin synthase A/B